MSDNVLNVLKLVFLALLYLFFLRVLWVVATEVRANRTAATPVPAPGQVPYPPGAAPYAEVGVAGPAPLPVVEIAGQPVAPVDGPTPGPRPKKGRRGTVNRLVVLEPRDRRGTTFGIAAELTMGRSHECTVQVLDDTFISSLHCRIFREIGRAHV